MKWNVMSTDIDAIAIRSRLRRISPSHECPERGIIESDIQTLIHELARARDEARRLTAEDADLRASAEAWCRLYEGTLARADAAEEELARVRASLPDRVQSLYGVLDRVADLSYALGTIIRDCVTCSRDSSAMTTPEMGRTVEACARCAQALEALKGQLG
jgi:hypothetical protein